MICRLCLNTLDEQNAVLLFAAAENESNSNDNKTIPENYLVQLISTHLYLCLSRDDAISTSICSDCCAQLESFHNFWKLVELKQTTLCSQFLEIDCDVNWSEEGGDVELQTPAFIDIKQEPVIEAEPELDGDPTCVLDEFKAAVAATHKFPCMFCDKSFKMRRYLEEHVATHTGDRPIACAYCNTAFRCRSNMYTHVKTKHTTQWQKARAERDAAKISSSSSIQIQRTVNGDNDKFVDTSLAANELDLSDALGLPVAAPNFQISSVVSIKNEPMEAINLTVIKEPPSPVKRLTRSSRRKTHSPKKAVQHTDRSHSGSEDSTNEATTASAGGATVDLHEKRLKTEYQQTLTTTTMCKENELMLANYNAVAAVVAAQQQSLMQQELLTAIAAVNSTAVAAAAALSSQSSMQAATAEPYTCSICGQVLRNQRALNNHLHNKHSGAAATSSAGANATILELPICGSCGELCGRNHRCLSKAKYACDVCGKSFKMKRYLEEHFATHTGVKLHTCAFCPTEFRSKSNMYHHTKRKHKLEWERSRASRNAAKSASQHLQQQHMDMEEPAINDDVPS